MDAILIYGHGNIKIQSFDETLYPGANSGDALYIAPDGRVRLVTYVRQPSFVASAGPYPDVATILAGKFHNLGGQRIGLLGCRVGHGPDSIVTTLGIQIPNVYVYGSRHASFGFKWGGRHHVAPFEGGALIHGIYLEMLLELIRW